MICIPLTAQLAALESRAEKRRKKWEKIAGDYLQLESDERKITQKHEGEATPKSRQGRETTGRRRGKAVAEVKTEENDDRRKRQRTRGGSRRIKAGEEKRKERRKG